jgi:predicted esterase
MTITNLGELGFPENASGLPIIICFHGAGTNATIFQIQAHSIIQSLKTKFNFLFLDAPFASLPGPGVAPLFSDLKPFFRWHCDRLSAERFNVEMDEIERERKAVRALLLDKLLHHGRHKIVGVMAFSQGARVATAFCMDEELGKDIKFAIMIAGTFPILSLARNIEQDSDVVSLYREQRGLSGPAILDHQEGGPDVNSSCWSRPCRPPRVQIPSVHVRGLRDPWLSEGERLLKTYYNQDQALVVEFNGGHQVPVAKKDVDQITEGVMKLWEQVQQNNM